MYRFNPLTPMNLIPLPIDERVAEDTPWECVEIDWKEKPCVCDKSQ